MSDLEELRKRIAHAIDEITAAKLEASSDATLTEYWRLEGKRQGLMLAADYLRGINRGGS